MRHFLNVIRAIFHPVTAIAFVVALTAVIAVSAIGGNLLDRDQVKRWVSDAQIYDQIAPSIVSLAENSETGKTFAEDIADSPLDEEAVDAAIATAYSPSYFLSAINEAIDASYDRLENGATEDTQFSIAATDRIEIFTDQFDSVLRNELSDLRACSAEEVEEFGDEFNPLTITCIPEEGFSLDDEIDGYLGQLDSQGSFLQAISLTDEDVFESGTVENSFDSLVRLQFLLPIIVIGLVVLFIISAKHPFAAMRNLGYVSIVTSIVVGIVFLVINQFGRLTVPVDESSSPTVVFTADVVVPVIQNAIADISTDGARISIFSTLLGIILIAIHFIIEKTHVGRKMRGAELYKKFAGSHAVSIADISAEANKSEGSKKQMLEDVKKVKKMKELANDNEHTVEEIAKAAKKKPVKRKAAKKKTTKTTKKTAKKTKNTKR